jgi:hypothetical protein
MQRLIPVRIYFGFKLYIMLRKYMLVGTLIMHDSFFTKVTGCDKFYLYKGLFAIAAFFCSEIIIGQWFEPGVAP